MPWFSPFPVFSSVRCGGIKVPQGFLRSYCGAADFCDDFQAPAFPAGPRFCQNQGNLKSQGKSRPQNHPKLQHREENKNPKNLRAGEERGKRKLKSRCKEGILTQRFQLCMWKWKSGLGVSRGRGQKRKAELEPKKEKKKLGNTWKFSYFGRWLCLGNKNQGWIK